MGLIPPVEKIDFYPRLLLVRVEDIVGFFARALAQQGTETAKRWCQMTQKKLNTRKKELERQISESLKKRGIFDRVHEEKMIEYIELWQLYQELSADVKARGAVVFDPKREMDVENRSVSIMLQVSKQMTALYTLLGMKDDAAEGESIEL